MASDSSFDIVSKVDRQEVDNALNQAAREVGQRFDFKGTEASIKWSGDAIAMQANGEERVKAIWDVFQTKLCVAVSTSNRCTPPSPDFRARPGT